MLTKKTQAQDVLQFQYTVPFSECDYHYSSMSHIMHHHIHAIQFGIRLKAFLFSSCLYWSEKKAQKNWKKIKVLISLFPSNWEKKEINFHFLVLKLEEEKEVCNTKHLFTKGTALTSSIEISVHQYSICRHNTQFSHYLEQLNHNLWGEEIVDVLCQSLMLRMLHRFLASGIVGTFSKPDPQCTKSHQTIYVCVFVVIVGGCDGFLSGCNWVVGEKERGVKQKSEGF